MIRARVTSGVVAVEIQSQMVTGSTYKWLLEVSVDTTKLHGLSGQDLQKRINLVTELAWAELARVQQTLKRQT